MTSGFRSILWLTSDEHSGRVAAEPDFFADLNLDQIASAATAGRGEYDLVPFFHAPLQSLDAVRYRQEIVRDLESPALRACLRDFAGQMRAVRDAEALIEKLYHQRQKEAWFRDAVETYCAAVRTLSEALGPLDLQSRGFRAFRDFIADHVSAPSFTSLVEETRAVAAGLAEVTYCLHIDGSRVTVRRYGDEPDYSTEIAATFEKFKQGDVKARRIQVQ